MNKEPYIQQVDRLTEQYISEGMDPDAAYDLAGVNAHSALNELLADRADYLRQIEKDTF